MPRTRGSPWLPNIRLVSAQTSASSRSGDPPPDSPSGPKSHTLARTEEAEPKQSDGFCNTKSIEDRNLGRSEGHCKTHVGLGPNLQAAIEWLAVHRDEIAAAPIPYVRESFGLTALEAVELTKLKAQLEEEVASLAQQFGRAGHFGGGASEPKTLGKQFVESDRFQNFIEGGFHRSKSGRIDLTVKANLTSLTTDAAGSVGAARSPAYRDALVPMEQRRLTVRDLLPVIQITSSAAEVPVQKGRTNNAGMVAEGVTKPQSDLQFELKTFTPRVIAHWMKTSRQVLEDAPQLKGLIDSELIYGLKLKEEAQLLLGDNTGQNLHGMIPQATAYAAPTVIADINLLDVIALAALQAALADYEADGVIVHPSDWLEMRLLKDSTGQYIFGPPGVVVEPRVFGLPLVATPAMTARKFLVGQYQIAGTIYDRWEARVEMAYEGTDFIDNMVTILGEERLAFGVKRPSALIYGDFDAALAP